MTRCEVGLTHEFVEYIPEDIQENKLYISIPYATAMHKCCCGCEKEVVTPLSPTDWKLIFDGQTVTLDPSIGNWSFNCKSHYWIKHNKIIWAPKWSEKEIQRGRDYDLSSKYDHYSKARQTIPIANPEKSSDEKSFWSKLKKLLCLNL